VGERFAGEGKRQQIVEVRPATPLQQRCSDTSAGSTRAISRRKLVEVQAGERVGRPSESPTP
jgi:hypothetical protein